MVNVFIEHYIVLSILEMSFCLSDTTCLIQDVVSTPCGDTRMARRCMRVFMTSQYGMLRNPSKQKQRHLNIV